MYFLHKRRKKFETFIFHLLFLKVKTTSDHLLLPKQHVTSSPLSRLPHELTGSHWSRRGGIATADVKSCTVHCSEVIARDFALLRLQQCPLLKRTQRAELHIQAPTEGVAFSSPSRTTTYTHTPVSATLFHTLLVPSVEEKA